MIWSRFWFWFGWWQILVDTKWKQGWWAKCQTLQGYVSILIICTPGAVSFDFMSSLGHNIIWILWVICAILSRKLPQHYSAIWRVSSAVAAQNFIVSIRDSTKWVPQNTVQRCISGDNQQGLCDSFWRKWCMVFEAFCWLHGRVLWNLSNTQLLTPASIYHRYCAAFEYYVLQKSLRWDCATICHDMELHGALQHLTWHHMAVRMPYVFHHRQPPCVVVFNTMPWLSAFASVSRLTLPTSCQALPARGRWYTDQQLSQVGASNNIKHKCQGPIWSDQSLNTFPLHTPRPCNEQHSISLMRLQMHHDAHILSQLQMSENPCKCPQIVHICQRMHVTVYYVRVRVCATTLLAQRDSSPQCMCRWIGVCGLLYFEFIPSRVWVSNKHVYKGKGWGDGSQPSWHVTTNIMYLHEFEGEPKRDFTTTIKMTSFHR